MQLYVNLDDEKGAKHLLAEMHQAGSPAGTTTYNTLLQLFVKQKNVDSAFAVIEEMKQAGVQRDSTAYCLLLQVCARSNNSCAADLLMKEMRICRTTYPYSTSKFNQQLRMSALHECSSQETDQIFADMIWLKVKSDHQTFAALVCSCGYSNNPDKAEFWFKEAVCHYKIEVNKSLAETFQISVGMERALVVCSELGVDLRQLLAAGKGKGGKDGKGGKGRSKGKDKGKGKGKSKGKGKGKGKGGGSGRGDRDNGQHGGSRGRQHGGGRGGYRRTAGGNGKK
jgi:pentatricopeptide repeat protein